ncbi:hypothetical protein CYMTET_15675 [Cymbomonas tetramitiformis]|uniref:Uncharacterized protein n=1 Tax=Cymbomonas tetramitiformis TaxID=36881 RepID=A0AAE0GE35_9CHLO|nr:hypothetical protein CYMTET_15675 [Cymbomonas tetramitiformis]
MVPQNVARGGQVGTRQFFRDQVQYASSGFSRTPGRNSRWSPAGIGFSGNAARRQGGALRQAFSFTSHRSHIHTRGSSTFAGLQGDFPTGDDAHEAYSSSTPSEQYAQDDVCNIPEDFLPRYWSDQSAAEDELEIWLVGDSDFGFEEEDGDYDALSYETAWWEELDVCYVIAFQGPNSDTAGFYANRAEHENGPMDIILVFESFDDAHRHCGLLQANIPDAELPEAVVEPIAPATLLNICEDKGCHCSVQKQGSLLMPPDQIVIEEDIEAGGTPWISGSGSAASWSATGGVDFPTDVSPFICGGAQLRSD